MLQQLLKIIETSVQHPAPTNRYFAYPEEWVDVCVGIGKDEVAYITLHKDALAELRELVTLEETYGR